MKSLNLQCDPEHLNVSDENHPIEIAVKKFKNHQSWISIKISQRLQLLVLMKLRLITDNPDPRKSGIFEGIPANCLKGVSDIFAKFLHTVWNDEGLTDLKLLREVKLAGAAFKKGDSTLVENYRPISFLPVISKIFDRIMLNQITTYMNEYLCPHLRGYWKGFNTQTVLFSYWEMEADHREKGLWGCYFYGSF